MSDRKPLSPKQEAFVRELTALTTKYGLAIRGCGCCDSPYVFPLTAEWCAGAYDYTNADGEKETIDYLRWATQEEIKNAETDRADR